MAIRLCPHDQTTMIEAQQLFYPVNLQPIDTTRMKALFTGSGGVQAHPFACPSCGYVGFFLDPSDITAFVAP